MYQLRLQEGSQFQKVVFLKVPLYLIITQLKGLCKS